ncbi:hypothetical protein NIA73_13385 [Anaerobutyricum hallii]|nr:hypothetical protein [Anaerobutyricum hallii]
MFQLISNEKLIVFFLLQKFKYKQLSNMVVAFFDWKNLKMNDKNFIEELRQKREEYGVTQTRLRSLRE